MNKVLVELVKEAFLRLKSAERELEPIVGDIDSSDNTIAGTVAAVLYDIEAAKATCDAVLIIHRTRIKP